jgi:hypothetical protein
MPPPPSSLDPVALIEAAPSDEYALLELTCEWPQLEGVDGQLAAALRVFVVTRDPLDWIPDRGDAWATVNTDGDTLELPLYISRDEVRRRLTATDGDLTAAVAPVAEAAVTAAGQRAGVVLAGGYPALAARGELPRLVDVETPRGPSRLGSPSVAVLHDDWEPLGLGAIQDLVQDAFGPVALDRSLVRLPALDSSFGDCPACRGRRFGFPGELAEFQPVMCPRHRELADDVTSSRIARARASNGQGMRAIVIASGRLDGLPEPDSLPLPQRHATAVGRNDPCPCGSGRKYKQCCGR